TWAGKYNNITSLSFGYDADGNRTFKTADRSFTGNYNYTPGTNRLASITGNSGAATFTYDAMGEMTNDGTYKYSNDVTGNLNAVNDATTNAVLGTYAYNGFGQRVQQTAGGVAYSYLYDLRGHVAVQSLRGAA